MAIRQTFVERLMADSRVSGRVESIRAEVVPLIGAAFSNASPDEVFPEPPVAAFRASPHLEMIAVRGRLKTAFFRAAVQGDVVLTLAYLKAGYPANYQDEKTGETALHVAAAVNAVDVVRVLISSGSCDYLIRDKRGRLAAELAYSEADNMVTGRLLAHMASKQGTERGVQVTRRP